ncbi:alpha/beta-hydrolase [Microthyrium microscopicum]|uniref:Carboxylic ester hydrolase n=1 Tax=Microthyrium microscopicum TaxID=703497 RepID=A0A6A6TVQ7_9PEZI|nr:alpha/beta-hydrolase [Microthyrium microscopicum]
MKDFRGLLLSAIIGLTTAAPTPSHSARSRNVTIDHATGLPIVDLGYQLHRALVFNETGDYYNFTNIRYAASPTGDLRFREPQSPRVNRTHIDDGHIERVCPQSYPLWEDTSTEFVIKYLSGGYANETSAARSKRQAPPLHSRETEDCLFLDIAVPKPVFENAGNDDGVPVLVWIFGGGYIGGDKSGSTSGSPAGMLKRADNGIIYVAINYRLGAFGWLGGETYENSDGVPNLGFYDQRFALQWVQDHIAEFGGDPDRVTVMGESSGASGILHQITAFGGDADTLFSQAIVQSPGFLPMVQPQKLEDNLQTFLNLSGVSSIEEARKLPSEKLVAANFQMVTYSSYGSFTFGPTIDHNFVQTLPALALKNGDFDDDIRLLIGHNSDEGLIFASASTVNASVFPINVVASAPTLSQEDLDFIDNKLYPAVFDGSAGWPDDVMRSATFAADIGFLCNAYALGKYTKDAYMYEFGVYPALHGTDIQYTFYNGPSTPGSNAGATPTNSTLAKRGVKEMTTYNKAAVSLQEWITSFAMTGKPSTSHPEVAFPLYGGDQKILKLVDDQSAPVTAKDDIVADRCNAWIDRLFPALIKDL